MTAEDKSGTGEPSAEALKAAKAIAQLRHPPLPIDLVVLVARDIEDFARQAVEARVTRIVAALEARKQTAAISEERANKNNKPHIALVYHNEIEVLDEAIAIAKGEEEGG